MTVNTCTNVVDIVRFGSTLSFVMNPEFQNLINNSDHTELVTTILDIAVENLQNGETITFTHRPNIDLIISLSLDESGLIFIDSMGATTCSPSDAVDYLQTIMGNI